MAGVCSGLAVHLGVPVMVIRGGLIALTFLGVGAVAYLWLWVTVPEDSPEASASGTLSPGLVRVRQERAAQSRVTAWLSRAWPCWLPRCLGRS